MFFTLTGAFFSFNETQPGELDESMMEVPDAENNNKAGQVLLNQDAFHDLRDALLEIESANSSDDGSTWSQEDIFFDAECFLHDQDVLEQCIATETERERLEDEEAHDFLKMFQFIDLDPNSHEKEDHDSDKDTVTTLYERDDTVDHNSKDVCPPCEEVSEGYTFREFSYFDTRREEEKLMRKNSQAERVSQNQLYFWQNYRRKVDCPGNQCGRFAGLVHRANIQNREDTQFLVIMEESIDKCSAS